MLKHSSSMPGWRFLPNALGLGFRVLGLGFKGVGFRVVGF